MIKIALLLWSIDYWIDYWIGRLSLHTWSSFLFDCILLYDVALNRFVVVLFVLCWFVLFICLFVLRKKGLKMVELYNI